MNTIQKINHLRRIIGYANNLKESIEIVTNPATTSLKRPDDLKFNSTILSELDSLEGECLHKLNVLERQELHKSQQDNPVSDSYMIGLSMGLSGIMGRVGE